MLASSAIDAPPSYLSACACACALMRCAQGVRARAYACVRMGACGVRACVRACVWARAVCVRACVCVRAYARVRCACVRVYACVRASRCVRSGAQRGREHLRRSLNHQLGGARGHVRLGDRERHALQRNAMRCTAMQRNEVRCTAMQRNVVRCTAMQRNVVRCTAMQRNVVRCTAMQRNVVRCTAMQRLSTRTTQTTRQRTTGNGQRAADEHEGRRQAPRSLQQATDSVLRVTCA
jgi:hypothetical protein